MSRKVAAPFDPVVAVLLLAVAPAGLGVAVTTTPIWLTGLPLASCSCTTGCCCSGAPLCAVLDGGVVSASLFAAPAVPCAVNVTGLPVRPAAVAVSRLGPAAALRVQEVAAAIPSVPVGTGVVGVTVPLPASVANVTATPATGLPPASLTITEGGGVTAVPAGADVPPPLAAIDVAAPALSAIGPELTGVSPVPPEKLRVYLPAAPAGDRPR